MNTIDNKYTKWYYNLINSRTNRVLPNDVYSESHHIIPKSLGGTNRKMNRIRLLPREHFIAHLLLTKMFAGPEKYKMWKAFNRMLSENTIDHDRYRPTSRFYDLARRLVGIASSECNKGKIPWNKGIPRTDDVKKAISDANTGKIPWNKGIPRTDDVKIAISIARQGISPANKGRKEEIIECEVCKKMIGGRGNYSRWHGKNCRKK